MRLSCPRASIPTSEPFVSNGESSAYPTRQLRPASRGSDDALATMAGCWHGPASRSPAQMWALNTTRTAG